MSIAPCRRGYGPGLVSEEISAIADAVESLIQDAWRNRSTALHGRAAALLSQGAWRGR